MDFLKTFVFFHIFLVDGFQPYINLLFYKIDRILLLTVSEKCVCNCQLDGGVSLDLCKCFALYIY